MRVGVVITGPAAEGLADIWEVVALCDVEAADRLVRPFLSGLTGLRRIPI